MAMKVKSVKGDKVYEYDYKSIFFKSEVVNRFQQITKTHNLNNSEFLDLLLTRYEKSKNGKG